MGLCRCCRAVPCLGSHPASSWVPCTALDPRPFAVHSRGPQFMGLPQCALRCCLGVTCSPGNCIWRRCCRRVLSAPTCCAWMPKRLQLQTPDTALVCPNAGRMERMQLLAISPCTALAPRRCRVLLQAATTASPPCATPSLASN